MDTANEDFTRLMEGLRAGRPEAARELFERYGRELQLVVRRRLNQRLRTQFDSLDFTQDAWASFFHIPPERCVFQTADEFIAFISRIACRKVIDVYRQRLHTAKHSRHPVEPLRMQTRDDPGNEPPARQPTPSQLAMAEERWQDLLREQPPPVRRALEMLRLGHSHAEIAACLGVPAKTIQRVLQNLKRESP